MLVYKGYIASVSIDEETHIFHGEALDAPQIAPFEGLNSEEVERAFQSAVDAYLAGCPRPAPLIKKAVLTIDDAPSPAAREKIDFLGAHGIRALWFCNGMHLERRPEAALYAIGQGQILGNHAYEHPHFSELTFEEGQEQIRRTDELLDGLYRQAGAARPGRFFRFPYGDKGGESGPAGLPRRAAFQKYLRGLGYAGPRLEGITYLWYHQIGLAADVDWYWTYDSKDWALNRAEPVEGFESVEALLERVEREAPEDGCGLNTAGSYEIILMHDHERTTPHFITLVERLLSKVQFVSPLE